MLVDGTKIEIRGVDRLDLVHPDLGDLTYKQQLFVVAHRWALDTATPLTVEGWKDNIRAAVTATAPFAIPAALLAMKLHAIEDRSNGFDQTRKRGGDAWDMHQLLTRLDANGSVRAQLALAPPVVRGLVSEGLERVFIARKNLTAGWMRAIPQAAGVTGDELALPAESVLVALS
ncbi:MAG: hypothetical protein ABI658_00610 [Acidimicrobiales bacterium]